ncbi:MAG: phage tail tip lysozyme [Brachybacterium sp.]|uniref:phage tail tip lysozyme n=1 Tax=Brachybacterium sp. TaxID=1891286 RepID=UPI0026471301|nr:phage tail tip lysozyme [Brachybacterium sp.]MDN5688349.1 phage tail tip lysozyme [Brachybacterium sp.]
MADEHQHPGDDTGASSTPGDEALDGPGSGDLGSDSHEAPTSDGAGVGKKIAQKGAETGAKKATGSDVAVSALQGAQKARKGDIVGGAQDVTASGAGALTSGALTASGVGAPIAGAAGSAVTSLFQTKAFRIVIGAIVAVTVTALVLQAVVISSIAAASLGVLTSSISQSSAFSGESVCTDAGATGGGPSSVVGGDIEEKVWNYLRGAGYSEQQTAGVMGNIERESGFNPFIAQGSASTPSTSSGWGLVQWTAGRHAKVRDAVVSELGKQFYVAAPTLAQLPASMTQEDIDEMVLFQMGYIINELEGVEKAAGDHLAATSTIEEATRSFESKYERAGISAIDERIANAKAFYQRYSGSPVPEAGGTAPPSDAETDTETPSATMTPGDVASATGAAGTATCGGSSIAPSGEVGQVAECPDPSDDPAAPGASDSCVNIAALTKPSASMSCPDGTSDHGTTTAYQQGKGVEVRLCTLDGATDTNGRPIIMNAMIAPAFMAFWNDAKKQGIDLSFTSTYRSHAKQQQLYSESPGGAARPGWSNHEFGMAFDIAGFPASYSRHNCGSFHTPEAACSYPGSGDAMERWKQIRKLGLKHGMYIHDEEFWHIEFIPSGLSRGRNIDVYEG